MRLILGFGSQEGRHSDEIVLSVALRLARPANTVWPWRVSSTRTSESTLTSLHLPATRRNPWFRAERRARMYKRPFLFHILHNENEQ